MRQYHFDTGKNMYDPVCRY